MPKQIVTTVLVHEVQEGLLKVEDDDAVVDTLDTAIRSVGIQLVLERFGTDLR